MSDDQPIQMSMEVTVTVGDVKRKFGIRKTIPISMLSPYSEETLYIILSKPMEIVTRDALLKTAQTWREAHGLGDSGGNDGART